MSVSTIKSFFRYLLPTLAALTLILYTYTIGEGKENLAMKGNFIENLPLTFEYFFLWVMPYWWFTLLFLGIAIAAGLTLFRKKKPRA